MTSRAGTGCGCDCGGDARDLAEAQFCTLHKIEDTGAAGTVSTPGVKDDQVPHCWGADLPELYGNDVLAVMEEDPENPGTYIPYVYAAGSCLAKWDYNLSPIWNKSPGAEVYQVVESGDYVWAVHCRTDENSQCRFYVSRFLRTTGETGPSVEVPEALQWPSLGTILRDFHGALGGGKTDQSHYRPKIASSYDGGFYLAQIAGPDYVKACGTIWKYDSSGALTLTCDEILWPRDIASDKDGNLYVAAYPIPGSTVPATYGTAGDEKYEFGPIHSVGLNNPGDKTGLRGAWETQLCRCGEIPSRITEAAMQCYLGSIEFTHRLCGSYDLDAAQNLEVADCSPPIPYDKAYTLYKLDASLAVSWKQIQYEYKRVWWTNERLFAWAMTPTAFVYDGSIASSTGTLFEIDPADGEVISKCALKANSTQSTSPVSYSSYEVHDVAADDDDVYVLILGSITKLKSDLSEILWADSGNDVGIGSVYADNQFWFTAIDFFPDSGVEPDYLMVEKRLFATSYAAVPCAQSFDETRLQILESQAEEVVGYACNPGAADFDFQEVGDPARVFSLSCPCDSIPCVVTKTLVGFGCFAPITGGTATFYRFLAVYEGPGENAALVSQSWLTFFPFTCADAGGLWSDPVWIMVINTETASGWTSIAQTVSQSGLPGNVDPGSLGGWGADPANCYNPCRFGPTQPDSLTETCDDAETGSPWATGLFRPVLTSCDCCPPGGDDTLGTEGDPTPTEPFCGCANVPTTLYADVSKGAFSTTVTLAKVGSVTYDGLFACGSCEIFKLSLNCADTHATVALTTVAGPGSCALCVTTSAEVVPTCDPFAATFTLPISDPAGCGTVCGTASDTEWTIAVTE